MRGNIWYASSPGVGFTAPMCVWNKFPYYQVFKYKAPVFVAGRKQASTAKIYANPLKIALEYREMLNQGQVASQADLSRLLGVSRAKITQTMNLLRLAPEIQDIMISLEETDKRLQILTERRLRSLVQIKNGAKQYRRFQKLIDDEIDTVERVRSQ